MQDAAQEARDSAEETAHELQSKVELENFGAGLALNTFDCNLPLIGQVKLYNAGTVELPVYKKIEITGANIIDPSLAFTNDDTFPIRIIGKSSEGKFFATVGQWNKKYCPDFK